MQKWITIAALTISLITLAASVWIYQRAETKAEQAFQRREKELVEKYKPEIEWIYKDFRIPEPQNPETLDELFGPLIKLFKRLDAPSS